MGTGSFFPAQNNMQRNGGGLKGLKMFGPIQTLLHIFLHNKLKVDFGFLILLE